MLLNTHSVLSLSCDPGIGGDHSLSWCILRAARDFTGRPVALVNLDAHFDTVDEYEGSRLT